MQVVSSSRRLSILLKSSSTFLQFDRFLVSNFPVNQDPPASHQWRTVSGNYTIHFFSFQRFVNFEIYKKKITGTVLEFMCFRSDFMVICTSLYRKWE